MKEFEKGDSLCASIEIDREHFDKLSALYCGDSCAGEPDLLSDIRKVILERLTCENALVARMQLESDVPSLDVNGEAVCLSGSRELISYALRYVVTTMVPTNGLSRSTYEIADNFARGEAVKFVVKD